MTSTPTRSWSCCSSPSVSTCHHGLPALRCRASGDHAVGTVLRCAAVSKKGQEASVRCGAALEPHDLCPAHGQPLAMWVTAPLCHCPPALQTLTRSRTLAPPASLPPSSCPTAPAVLPGPPTRSGRASCRPWREAPACSAEHAGRHGCLTTTASKAGGTPPVVVSAEHPRLSASAAAPKPKMTPLSDATICALVLLW